VTEVYAFKLKITNKLLGGMNITKEIKDKIDDLITN
jgi:hypothetical protein